MFDVGLVEFVMFDGVCWFLVIVIIGCIVVVGCEFFVLFWVL